MLLDFVRSAGLAPSPSKNPSARYEDVPAPGTGLPSVAFVMSLVDAIRTVMRVRDDAARHDVQPLPGRRFLCHHLDIRRAGQCRPHAREGSRARDGASPGAGSSGAHGALRPSNTPPSSRSGRYANSKGPSRAFEVVRPSVPEIEGGPRVVSQSPVRDDAASLMSHTGHRIRMRPSRALGFGRALSACVAS